MLLLKKLDRFYVREIGTPALSNQLQTNVNIFILKFTETKIKVS